MHDAVHHLIFHGAVALSLFVKPHPIADIVCHRARFIAF